MTRDKFKTLLGHRIVELRLKKGWTQADLAWAADKSPQAIEKLENGKVNHLFRRNFPVKSLCLSTPDLPIHISKTLMPYQGFPDTKRPK